MTRTDESEEQSDREQTEREKRLFGMTMDELHSKVREGFLVEYAEPYQQAIGILSDAQETLQEASPARQMINQAKWIIAEMVAMPNFRTGNHYIPPLVKEAIDRYVSVHYPVGDFLEAVLHNDFTMAVLRADYDSRRSLANIVHYISNTVPAEARGSKAAVEEWLRVGRSTGYEKS